MNGDLELQLELAVAEQGVAVLVGGLCRDMWKRQ